MNAWWEGFLKEINFEECSQKVRDHWEDLVVGGWTILKWILETYDGMVWIGLIWLRIGTSEELL
jgi:hypothetical protein